MAEPAIRVEGAGKRYAQRLDVSSLGGGGRRRSSRQDLWALRDVDLEVAAGESIGVLGANGAGKSTLLSLLAGVTAPTTGRVQVRGRIAPLLAVGVGFHPELTGRENVFVNGAMLGMEQASLRARFDEIVAFAGLDAFIDTPVKFYSSGMYVRLGFAVATAVEPDVLIVDEVLAVGDLDFQTRSFDRIRAVRDLGTAVVVVSHNALALQVFCERGAVVAGGRIVADTDIDTAVSRHAGSLGAQDESGPAVILGITRADGRPAAHVDGGETVVVQARVALDGLRHPAVELAVADERMLVHCRRLPLTGLAAGAGSALVRLSVDLPLVTGSYEVTVGVGETDAPEPLPAGPGQLVRVTASRIAHGTLDLGARVIV
jgi:ABC-type polysaccharide/polyol phosphate transport system ATPase subunit